MDKSCHDFNFGTEMTIAAAKPVPHKTKQKRPLMSYVGIAKGLYGKTAQEVAAYLESERSSWER